jgi:hypothetical protein
LHIGNKKKSALQRFFSKEASSFCPLNIPQTLLYSPLIPLPA